MYDLVDCFLDIVGKNVFRYQAAPRCGAGTVSIHRSAFLIQQQTKMKVTNNTDMLGLGNCSDRRGAPPRVQKAFLRGRGSCVSLTPLLTESFDLVSGCLLFFAPLRLLLLPFSTSLPSPLLFFTLSPPFSPAWRLR